MSSHHRASELDAEQPLFVDPGEDDPTMFIEFRREYAAPVSGNGRGAATVEALQLNRPALVERRRDRHQLLILCVTVVAEAIRLGAADDLYRPTIHALEFIIAAAAEAGEYSSMTRSFLRRVAPWRARWVAPASALLDALRTEAAQELRLRVDAI